MKKLILGILLVSAVFGVKAQAVEKDEPPIDVNSQTSNKEKMADDTFDGFIDYEQMPEFKGGEKALWKYLKDNLIYPKAALEKKIQGKVIVRFLVDKTGGITRINVLRGIGGGCDEEAMRIISLMPRWIPGKQGGRPVAVWYTLPIRFDLSKY